MKPWSNATISIVQAAINKGYVEEGGVYVKNYSPRKSEADTLSEYYTYRSIDLMNNRALCLFSHSRRDFGGRGLYFSDMFTMMTHGTCREILQFVVIIEEHDFSLGYSQIIVTNNIACQKY